MNVWVLVILILILAEVWWFGIHCTTYLSDIRDHLEKIGGLSEDRSDPQ
jgi:hypothetical protein